MISGPTPSPGIKVTGTRPERKNIEIIVTIFSWVKQLQKGEQDRETEVKGKDLNISLIKTMVNLE